LSAASCFDVSIVVAVSRSASIATAGNYGWDFGARFGRRKRAKVFRDVVDFLDLVKEGFRKLLVDFEKFFDLLLGQICQSGAINAMFLLETCVRNPVRKVAEPIRYVWHTPLGDRFCDIEAAEVFGSGGGERKVLALQTLDRRTQRIVGFQLIFIQRLLA